MRRTVIILAAAIVSALTSTSSRPAVEFAEPGVARRNATARPHPVVQFGVVVLCKCEPGDRP